MELIIGEEWCHVCVKNIAKAIKNPHGDRGEVCYECKRLLLQTVFEDCPYLLETMDDMEEQGESVMTSESETEPGEEVQEEEEEEEEEEDAAIQVIEITDSEEEEEEEEDEDEKLPRFKRLRSCAPRQEDAHAASKRRK